MSVWPLSLKLELPPKTEAISRFRRFNHGVFVAVLLIALDQWLKSAFPSTVNTGVSFSVLAGFPSVILWATAFLLAAVSLQAVLWLGRPRLWWWSVIFVAGGLSNWIDRWQLGGVRDIWFVPILNVQNNFADWLLFFAVSGMIATTWFESRTHE